MTALLVKLEQLRRKACKQMKNKKKKDPKSKMTKPWPPTPKGRRLGNLDSLGRLNVFDPEGLFLFCCFVGNPCLWAVLNHPVWSLHKS